MEKGNLMNALHILNEIKYALSELKNKGERKIINLTNFPLTPVDVKFLEENLGKGHVEIFYRSEAGVTVWRESKISGVWWGEYKNAGSGLVLKTIEITDFPELAKSQPEDIADGIEKLEQVLDEMLKRSE